MTNHRQHTMVDVFDDHLGIGPSNSTLKDEDVMIPISVQKPTMPSSLDIPSHLSQDQEDGPQPLESPPSHHQSSSSSQQVAADRNSQEPATLTEEELMEKVLKDLEDYEKRRRDGLLVDLDDQDFSLEVDFEDDDFNEMFKEITNSQQKRIGRRTQVRRSTDSEEDVCAEVELSKKSSSSATSSQMMMADSTITSLADLQLNGMSNHHPEAMVEEDHLDDHHDLDPFEGTIKVEEVIPIPVLRPTRPSSLDIPSCLSQDQDHGQQSIESPPSVQQSSSPQELVNIDEDSREPEVERTPTEPSDFRVGYFKPYWIPDHEAPSCMSCDSKFTLVKRRHHCRGCGKVLCATCCYMKIQLPYMDFKEARVCSVCHKIISDYEDLPSSEIATYGSPSDAGLLEGAVGGEAFVPVSVLKKPDQPRGEPKQVVFSDGVRPGTSFSDEATNGPSTPASTSPSATSFMKKHLQRLRSPPADVNPTSSSVFPTSTSTKMKSSLKPSRTFIEGSDQPLPPVIDCPLLAANPTVDNLMTLLRTNPPVNFYLSKNLHVGVKLVRLDCCNNAEVWSFASKGLASVAQDEVAVILERVDGESSVPRDVFKLISHVYESSSRGVVHSEMSHLLFPDGIFGAKDQSGFIFVRPTVQCLSNLLLPSTPFLIALLVQRSEIPWIKVFPLRFLLRLGLEFSAYPFPIVSYRQRSPMFGDVGHTILTVLADFRNFQYTIPVIQGVTIRREVKKVVVSLPKNRFDSVVKVLNQNNEHVLAIGGNFNLSAQAHLACLQTEEGQYQTRVISPFTNEEHSNGVNHPEPWENDRKDDHRVTGACFVVFSGALKTTSGLSAKVSLVEDGILVTIPPNIMTDLKTALRDLQDFSIKCGKTGASEDALDDIVTVEWTKDDQYYNVGVRSPIDGKSMQGTPSVRVHNSTDYANNKLLIRWTEVFFLEGHGPSTSMDATKVAGIISQSLSRALVPHLETLFLQGMTKIGLRVSLDPDRIGYEAGSNGQSLPDVCVNDLDGSLIPIISGTILSSLESSMVLELLFYVIFK